MTLVLLLSTLTSVRSIARPFMALRGGRAASSVRMMASTIPTAVEAPIALTKVLPTPNDAAPAAWAGDLLVLPFWEVDKNETLTLSETQTAVDGALGGALSDMIEDHEFKGAAGSSAVLSLPRGSAARRLAVVGLGKEDKFKVSGATKLGGALATMATDQKVKSMAVELPSTTPALLQSAIEGTLLGLSPDTRYKSDGDENKPPPLETLDLLGASADADLVTRARS